MTQKATRIPGLRSGQGLGLVKSVFGTIFYVQRCHTFDAVVSFEQSRFIGTEGEGGLQGEFPLGDNDVGVVVALALTPVSSNSLEKTNQVSTAPYHSIETV